MRYDILTLFPHIFDSYFNESILKRAQEAGKIEIVTHNIRDFANDKHKTTDDIPYGGGAGMVLKVQPIFDAVQFVKQQAMNLSVKEKFPISNFQFPKKRGVRERTILFSAKGKRFTQRDAERLAQYDRLIFICGRYEGVDERVAEHLADEEISIGEYVLTGGEIPAMALVDSVTRLLPGVLGNEESLREESFSRSTEVQSTEYGVQSGEEQESILEYPQYTRPEEFNGWRVPEVLLSGNHGEIEKWRNKNRS